MMDLKPRSPALLKRVVIRSPVQINKIHLKQSFTKDLDIRAKSVSKIELRHDLQLMNKSRQQRSKLEHLESKQLQQSPDLSENIIDDDEDSPSQENVLQNDDDDCYRGSIFPFNHNAAVDRSIQSFPQQILLERKMSQQNTNIVSVSQSYDQSLSVQKIFKNDVMQPPKQQSISNKNNQNNSSATAIGTKNQTMLSAQKSIFKNLFGNTLSNKMSNNKQGGDISKQNSSQSCVNKITASNFRSESRVNQIQIYEYSDGAPVDLNLNKELTKQTISFSNLPVVSISPNNVMNNQVTMQAVYAPTICNPLNTMNTIDQSCCIQPQEMQTYPQTTTLGDIAPKGTHFNQQRKQILVHNHNNGSIGNTGPMGKEFPGDYPENQQQITPCETEITQHYDMDEHRNNFLPQSTHRKNKTTTASMQLSKPSQGIEQAVAPNLGEKYLSIVKKQPHHNNQISSQLDTKRSYHVNNVSVCLTEEIPHQSKINPVNLADKDWTDPYKLNKLLTLQKKGHYMANQIFGNVCACNNQQANASSLLINSCQSLNVGQMPGAPGAAFGMQQQFCPTQQRIDQLFDSLTEIEKKLQNNHAARQSRQARKNKKSVRLIAERLQQQQQQQQQLHQQFLQGANIQANANSNNNTVNPQNNQQQQESLPQFFNQGNGPQISSITQTVGTGLTTKMSHRQNNAEVASSNQQPINKSESTSEKQLKHSQNVLIDQSESHIMNPSLEDDETDSDSSLEIYNQFLRNNFNDMSQITVTQSLHQSQVMGVAPSNKNEIPVLFEDRPLQIDPQIKIEESKFGQPGLGGVSGVHFQSYQHNPGLSKDSSSFDHTNVNNISSFGGSFMNLGRPSDMNEDRIISKETQEARLKAQKMNQKTVLVNQKHIQGNDMVGAGIVGHRNGLDMDGSQDFLLRKQENKGLWEFGESNLAPQMGLNQQCADLSNIEKNQSISAVLEASTSDLDQMTNDLHINNQQSKIIAQQTHFNQYKKSSTSVQNSKLNGQLRAAMSSNHIPDLKKLNSIILEDQASDVNDACRENNAIEQSYNTNTNTNKNKVGDDSEIFMPSQYNTTFDHKPGPSGSSEHLTNIQKIGYILGGANGEDLYNLQSRQQQPITGTDMITTTTILQGDITAEHMPMMNVDIPQANPQDSRNDLTAGGSVFNLRQHGIFKTEMKKRAANRQKIIKKAASPVQKKMVNKTALNDFSCQLDEMDQQDTSNLLQQIQNCNISEVNINLNFNQVENGTSKKKQARASKIETIVEAPSSGLLRIQDADAENLQNRPPEEQSCYKQEVVNHIHVNINGSQNQNVTIKQQSASKAGGGQMLKISSKLVSFKSPKSANTSIVKQSKEQRTLQRSSSKLAQRSPKKVKRPSSHLQPQYNTQVVQKNTKSALKQSKSPNPCFQGSGAISTATTSKNLVNTSVNGVKKSDSAQIMKSKFSRLKSPLKANEDQSKSQMLSLKKTGKKSPIIVQSEARVKRNGGGQNDSVLKAYSSQQVQRQQSQRAQPQGESKLSNYSTTITKKQQVDNNCSLSPEKQQMNRVKSTTLGMQRGSGNASMVQTISGTHLQSNQRKNISSFATVHPNLNPQLSQTVNPRASFSLKNSTSMAFLKNKISSYKQC